MTLQQGVSVDFPSINTEEKKYLTFPSPADLLYKASVCQGQVIITIRSTVLWPSVGVKAALNRLFGHLGTAAANRRLTLRLRE